MKLWRVSLTVEVEAEDEDGAFSEAMRLDDSVILSSAVNLTERYEQELAREAELQRAMALPFGEGLSIIRAMTCEDYKLAFREDVGRWCARHAAQILAIHEENKKR